MIPQQPQLFSGSVRFNLDPSGRQHSEEALGTALRYARLLPVPPPKRSPKTSEPSAIAAAKATEGAEAGAGGGASQLSAFLASPVEAGGANFSAGQCQLLALARALLREDAAVLALDEATANLDHVSDAAIQHALHAAGPARGRTTLVIAHRLGSVIDADSILVLSAGRVVEHGPTEELLSRPAGEFASMVDAVGETSAVALRERARALASPTARCNAGVATV